MTPATRIAPRLLTRADLRAYLGDITWTTVEQRMAAGRLPRPLWGLKPDDKAARWDLKAVDRALDAESDIPDSIEQGVRRLDRSFGLA